MKNENSIEKIIISNIEKFEPEFIYIFGSYALNKMKIDSDIDIAFYSLKNIDPFAIFLCAQKLGIELNKEVDLIDLKRSTTVFQNQVIRTGKVIYEKNRDMRARFEILTLKKYIELNDWRKEQLEAYNVSNFLKNKE